MPSNRMPLIECLDVLRQARRDDEVVITAMGTAREWMKLGSHPLDFVFVPSSMGQASSLGLGMALARPEQNFIVCNGDGSTLMNLGSLVTITAEAPENLTLLLFDNRVYEVTGYKARPVPPILAVTTVTSISALWQEPADFNLSMSSIRSGNGRKPCGT